MIRLSRLREKAASDRLCRGFADISSALRRFARTNEHIPHEASSPLRRSDSTPEEIGSPSPDVPVVDTIKARLFDASRDSLELFGEYRGLLANAREEFSRCQGAYDAIDALGEHLEDVLRERNISSFPGVPDAGLRRPSMSSLVSSVSSGATTLVGSSVPVSPMSSPKNSYEELTALAALTEPHQWRPHEMNSSIAARQRDSAWVSWFSTVKRKQSMEQSSISSLIQIVECEKMGLVTQCSEAKPNASIGRGSKKGGLLKMGTRRRKCSRSKHADSLAAVEALEAWTRLTGEKVEVESIATGLVDADPFRCEDSTRSNRVDEVKSRGPDPQHSGLDLLESFPSPKAVSPLIAPLKVKKRSKPFGTVDLLEITRKELAGLDAHLADVRMFSRCI